MLCTPRPGRLARRSVVPAYPETQQSQILFEDPWLRPVSSPLHTQGSLAELRVEVAAAKRLSHNATAAVAEMSPAVRPYGMSGGGRGGPPSSSGRPTPGAASMTSASPSYSIPRSAMMTPSPATHLGRPPRSANGNGAIMNGSGGYGPLMGERAWGGMWTAQLLVQWMWPVVP